MKFKLRSIILSILAVIIFILIIGGVTYAFFNYGKNGSTDNTITTGEITFLYTEVSGLGRGISISDAFPISTTQGKDQTGVGKVFDFKVTSTTKMDAVIPYEITARKNSGSNLDEAAVKLYLTTVDGNNETEVLLDNYSNLTPTSKVPSGKYTEKTIYKGRVPAHQSNYEQDFRLRMWIDEETDFSDGTMNNKTFAITVNVYANAISKYNLEPGLYDENDNLIKSWDQLVADGTITATNMGPMKFMRTKCSTDSSSLAGKLVIDNTITYDIGSTFKGCTELTEVVYPTNYSNGIGTSSFEGCTGLKKVTLSKNVSSIGNLAFSGCTSLTDINMPEHINTIGTSAFSNCTNLNLSLNEVDDIYSNAFYNIASLEYHGDLGYSDGYPWGAKVANGESFEDKLVISKDNLADLNISQSGDVVIPEKVTYNDQEYTIYAIANNTFNGNTSITSVTLPNTIKVIGSSAFNNCKNLKTINLPEGLNTIGPSAFQYCYALESISLPSTLEVLGDYAFNHCSNVQNTTVTIPASLKEIGDIQYPTHDFYDFGIDGKFNEFSVDASNKNYKSIDGILYSKDGSVLVSIPRGKTFENNTYIMPNEVTTLGELSFSRNKNINKVIISDNLVVDTYEVNQRNNLNFGNHLTIGIYAYTNINSYGVKSTNTRYAAVDGILYTKNMEELVAVPIKYSGVLAIPEGVTVWKKEAMWTETSISDINKQITSISIPSTLTSIEEGQLSYINGLVDKGITISVATNNEKYTINSETGKIIEK